MLKSQGASPEGCLRRDTVAYGWIRLHTASYGRFAGFLWVFLAELRECYYEIIHEVLHEKL